MKKVAIIFFGIILSLSIKAQLLTSTQTIHNTVYKEFDISKIADDTTYWFRVRGKTSINITFDFTDVSGDAAVLNIYKGSVIGDSIYYNSIDGLIETPLPLTLVKATYQKTAESDTMNTWGVMEDQWNADLVGVWVDPNSMTGIFGVIIER